MCELVNSRLIILVLSIGILNEYTASFIVMPQNIFVTALQYMVQIILTITIIFISLNFT